MSAVLDKSAFKRRPRLARQKQHTRESTVHIVNISSILKKMHYTMLCMPQQRSGYLIFTTDYAIRSTPINPCTLKGGCINLLPVSPRQLFCLCKVDRSPLPICC